MQASSYSAWLEQDGLANSTVDIYASDAEQVELHYGDLDEHFSKDRRAGVLQELRYSAADARTNAPNPSKIPIRANPYNALATYRTTVTRYREYREGDGRSRRVGLERDLQAAVRDSIEHLEPGLDIIDGGTERSVVSGRIDITARAADGTVVVIELKAGTARRADVGQVLSYMGDVAAEESGQVRGILVAGDFDNKARAAARVVPSLSLRSYSVTFEFRSVDDAAS